MSSHNNKEFDHIIDCDIKTYYKCDNEEIRASKKRELILKMIQLSQKSKYSSSVAGSLLQQSLLDYNPMSMGYADKFDQFLTEHNVNFELTDVSNTISRRNPKVFINNLKQKYKHLNVKCDEVTDQDVKEIFQATDDTKPFEKATSNDDKINSESDYNIKINTNEEDDEILSFDLPFNKNKKANQAINNEQKHESPKNSFSFNQRSHFTDSSMIKQNSSDQYIFTQENNYNSLNTVKLPDFHKKTANFENQEGISALSSSLVSNTNQNPYKRKFADESHGYCQPIRRQSSNPEESYHSTRKQPNNSGKGLQSYESSFKTGLEELEIRYEKKYGGATNSVSATTCAYKNPPSYSYNAPSKKTLGGRRTVQSAYVPPFAQSKSTSAYGESSNDTNNEDVDERLKHIDPKMIELIRNDIMDRFPPLSWNDIAGLDYAKSIIKEAVVWPMLRPDIFKGLRKPPRGILLFGPPGTGKTLIGKCIASQSKSTFFSISASSLTSKWIGEGEKMVRTLFAVAVVHQPSVIFIDEIDSLLCQRSESEHESSRRLKTEFLVQLDGATTSENERVLIVGATNRPQELDEAARRRLVRRLYIPLPELSARIQIIQNLLKSERCDISPEHIKEIGQLTEGFSGADMKVLCHEASMEPIRSIPTSHIDLVDVNDVRPVTYIDFRSALRCVRASVSQNDLKHYIEWDQMYGSGSGK